ncbi:MAG: CBU_0592 family membrane protein [Maritimibacter sp.]
MSLPTTILDLPVLEFFGIGGFLLYVANYTLLSLGKLTSHGTSYFAINFCAAALVLAGLMQSFNMASALIQMHWIIVSALAIGFRAQKAARTRRHAKAHMI